jgi:methionyl-tRNA formyltransferase
MKNLRIIFMGTPEFAVESLRQIHESGRNVVAVVTAADRKAGRGQKVQQSAVKKYAESKEIPVLQPTNLKSEDFLAELKSYRADIQVVVAFRMMPEVVWDMPPMGTFNLHASLLPNYRGAAPINWAIINGEKESGVTTFFLKHQIDTGDVLFQEKVRISEKESAGSLHDKLMKVGGKLVLKTFEAIESEKYTLIPQQDLISAEGKPTEAPKIFRADCEIDWGKPAAEVDQLIRGLSPYPAAWTTVYNESNQKKLNLKIFQVEISDIKSMPRSIKVIDQKLYLGTADYYLEIKELQLEGKKRMSVANLLNGFSFDQNQIIPS